MLFYLFIIQQNNGAGDTTGNAEEDADDDALEQHIEVGWPIFVLGLPRSGSELIHDYFINKQKTIISSASSSYNNNNVNIHSSHYCCKKTQPRTTLSSSKSSGSKETAVPAPPTKFP